MRDLFILTLALAAGMASYADLSTQTISSAAGVEATKTADGVVRITWARSDVPFHVDGAPIRPFAGLTSWAAFTETDDGVIVMGDTVVFQDEANPAMDAAFASGLEVTALHNHFFYDEPKAYFMHIGGRGSAEDLARGVRRIWDTIKSIRDRRPQPRPAGRPEPVASEIAIEPLAEIFGFQGTASEGMAKFSVGRRGTMNGVEVGGPMGLSTWAAFSGTDERAYVDGDFIMTADEVQTVLRALRASDIDIVALHNHMVGGSPVYYFVHFWGLGEATELAQGIRRALDAQEAVGR